MLRPALTVITVAGLAPLLARWVGWIEWPWWLCAAPLLAWPVALGVWVAWVAGVGRG
jgi:hypothetical protein